MDANCSADLTPHAIQTSQSQIGFNPIGMAAYRPDQSLFSSIQVLIEYGQQRGANGQQGFARGQFRLGEMHEVGRGVERNLIQARKWFAIAGESRYPNARKRKKKVAKEMTPGEIALGDMWAREFLKIRKAR